jgi:hypothetical protein
MVRSENDLAKRQESLEKLKKQHGIDWPSEDPRKPEEKKSPFVRFVGFFRDSSTRSLSGFQVSGRHWYDI